MKKLIVALLILSIILLSSCAADTEKAPETTESVDTTVVDETTVTSLNEESNIPEESTANEKGEDLFLALPNEYKEVIEDYKDIVEFRLSDRFESEWNNGNFGDYDKYYNADIQGNFSYMILDMLDYIDNPSTDSFGYILNDINDDTVPELFWITSDYEFIFAIFTINEGEACLLDAFWPRYKCRSLDSGVIYTMGSSGAAYTTYELRKLDKNSAQLTSVKEFGTDFYDENGSILYYHVSDGKKEYISEDRIDELFLEYPFENGEKWINSKFYYLFDDNISIVEG